MTIQMYDRIYLVGLSKTTKKYTIWYDKKVIFDSFDSNEIKLKLKKLRKLADKRETRHMIADMCGTSYRTAMKDMGLSH
jgi:hypothetical protein